MFILTLFAHNISVPVRLVVIPSFGGQFVIDTVGRAGSASFTAPSTVFDFETRLEVGGDAAAVFVQNSTADGALHVQMVNPRHGRGRLMHALILSGDPPVSIHCPNDPSRSTNCPGSIACASSSGMEYEMTC
jgi:hypothetical protein